MSDPAVAIYDFDKTPPEWQQLSDNGGDEDFIIVPGPTASEWLIDRVVDRLAVCDFQRVTLPDGRQAFITCHS